MYSVRRMEPRDAPVLIPLCREAVAILQEDVTAYSPQRIIDMLVQCVDMPRTYFGVVGERDGEVVGLKYACATMSFYSYNTVCWDVATYVVPKARSFALTYKLMQAYKQWAINIGAKQAYLGSTSYPHDGRVGKLFTRLGFQPVGSLHVMELDNGQRVAAA